MTWSSLGLISSGCGRRAKKDQDEEEEEKRRKRISQRTHSS